VRRLLLLGVAIGLLFPAGRALAIAAQASDEWIYLGVIAETSGTPAKWLGDTGFVYADAANKTKVIPAVGDRVQLTIPKSIRKTNAQGQKPFERPAVQGDTTGEFAPGTTLRVLEIGRRSTSKAGDRWECWVRVQR